MSHTHEFSEKEKKEPTQYANGTDSDDEINSFTALITEDHSHDIKLRTMTWQKVRLKHVVRLKFKLICS